MKKNIVLCFMLACIGLQAQNLNGTAFPKAYFPGQARILGSGFMIGNKAYIGIGYVQNFNTTYLDDFWEYDATSDSWTQKAAFAGGVRAAAIAFSIGNKGYVGAGASSNSRIDTKRDFWEYDPGTNTWTARANMPGPRRGAVGFSIGNKGYVGTGADSLGAVTNSFWQYNSATDTWTVKTNFPGEGRYYATGFSIGGIGYMGTGRVPSPAGIDYRADFFAYDTATNKWTARASLASWAYATGFSLAGKGYVGFPSSSNGGNVTLPPGAGMMDMLWEFNPATNTWVQRACFLEGCIDPGSTGNGRTMVMAVSNGSRAFLGFGGGTPVDWYEYKPNINYWQNGPPLGYSYGAACAIGNKFYTGAGSFKVLGGQQTVLSGYFEEYNETDNTTTSKAVFSGFTRQAACMVAVQGKIYFGTGADGFTILDVKKKDFWEYNPANNTWTQKADFGGAERYGTMAFQAGNRIYVGKGNNGYVNKNDLWEYNPATNTWTQKNNPPTGVSQSFTIGNRAYAIGDTKQVWLYQPASDTWVQKNNFPGTGRSKAVAFSIGSNGYYGTGSSNFTSGHSDFWEYDAANDSWKKLPPVPSMIGYQFGRSGRSSAVGVSTLSKGYVLSGDGCAAMPTTGRWTLNPWADRLLTVTAINPSTICRGDSIWIHYQHYDSSGSRQLTFQLSDSSGRFDNAIQLTVKTSGVGPDSVQVKIPVSAGLSDSYRVRIVSGADTSNSSAFFSISGATASITSPNPVQACMGDSAMLSVSAISGYSYQWLDSNTNVISGANAALFKTTQAGNYRVALLNANGCRDTSLAISVIIHALPVSSFSVNDTAQCETGNSFVMNNTSSGSSLTYSWNFGNSSTSTAASPSVSYSAVGSYTIRLVVSDVNTCMDTAWQNVRVKASPATPSLLAAPDTITCADVNIVLRTTAPATRSWLKNNTPLGVSADSLLISNSPGAYSLKVTNTENCEAVSSVLNISFKPVPPQPVISIAGNLLSSSASAGNQWYNSSGPISGQTGQTFTASAPGNYYSIVTLNGCSSLPSATQSFPATGVKTSRNNDIVVYPNPNKGIFNVRLTHVPLHVLLTDITGRVVWQQSNITKSEFDIEVSSLAEGSYFLKVYDESGISNLRVIIYP